MKKVVLFLLIATSWHFLNAQTATDLDEKVLYYMKHNNVPGASFALIRDGKIVLTKGYGYADINKDIPFTPNTILSEIASISKTVTATAVMKLWEQELFQLDDPINNYLPFPVKNPNYPSIPVTFRMLLIHSSSLINNVDDHSIETVIAPGAPPSLGNFLQNLLVPGGSLYNPSLVYYNYAPGSSYNYSNIGYVLLGYLVEIISGMSLEQYCQQNIFQPLCMNSTSWFFTGVDTNIVSRPYEHTPQNYPYALYENLDYPCRQLKTNIIDLSKFLLMHMNFGILHGTRILDSTTEVLMRVPQITASTTPDYRLDRTLAFIEPYWFATQETYLGLDGSTPGAGTAMFENMNDRTGIIFFQNVDNLFPAFFPLYFYLDTLVSNLSTAGFPLLNCTYHFNPCEQSTDYWITHANDWPLSTVPMKLGTKHYYTKNQSMALLTREINGDASIVLAKALITAKVNVAQGSAFSQIVLKINAAMGILGDKRLPYDNPISFSSATGIQMLELAATLNSYNEGNMNSVPCSGTPSITIANVANEMESATKANSLSVFPNPSTSHTTISFALQKPGKVSLTIHDLAGRHIKTITNSDMSAGNHQINLDSKNMASGLYVLRLQSEETFQVRKFIVQH